MSIEVLNIKLKRGASNVPWGFNIQGGREFSSPLVIQKVTVDSLSDKVSMRPGDYILKIGNHSVENFTHTNARNAIVECGNELELTLQRNVIPTRDDFKTQFEYPSQPEQHFQPQQQQHHHESLLEPVVTEPSTPKLSPQVGVAIKGDKLLLTQAYNSPLGLYSKQNVADALITTVKNLNLKENDQLIDETDLIQNLITSEAHHSASSSSKQQASNSYNQQSLQNMNNQYSSNNNSKYQQNFNQNNSGYAQQQQQQQSRPQPRLAAEPKLFSSNQQFQYQQQQQQHQYAAPPAPHFNKPYQPASAGGTNRGANPPGFYRGAKGSAILNTASLTSTIPTCSSCGDIIRGPFVSALNKTWCPDHFVCSNPSCGVNLENIGFIEENGKLYCEHDYEAYFAPRCVKCSQAIIGDCCKAMQKNYHPECFTCTHCHKPFPNGQFHVENGLPYCYKDFTQLFSSKCAGCQFPIDAGDQYVEALEQTFHVDCFTCAQCNCTLESTGFVVKSNKPYCKKHAR